MARKGTRSLGKTGDIFAAVMVTMAVCLLGIAVISYLLLNGKITETGVDLSIATLLVCAVFIGGQLLRMVEEKRLLHLIEMGGIVAVMMVTGGFMMEGEFQSISKSLLSVSVGCVLSAISFRKTSAKKRGRNARYR